LGIYLYESPWRKRKRRRRRRRRRKGGPLGVLRLGKCLRMYPPVPKAHNLSHHYRHHHHLITPTHTVTYLLPLKKLS